ncbi:MAG: selenium cofactor biosynthesis protein YqeC [Desulfotomaculaceae bacterium]|nr:selenium cofactor biosynthesis protein YqeC [Desulfotomaculaceae bacterium]
MNLAGALGLSEREVVSFVGGGGKTTLMFRLAEEIPFRYRVVITTTTKIFLPPPDKYTTLLIGKRAPVENDLAGYLQSGIRPVLGSVLLKNNKIEGIDPEHIKPLQNCADTILVEADGSKGLSLKGYLDHEPVIPRSTTMLVIVIGADVIGKTISPGYVHRPEVVAKRTGLNMGSVIDAEVISRLITHPEGPLRLCPFNASALLFINKTDCLEDPGEVYRLGRLLLGGRIKKVILGSAISENPVIDILEY